MSELQKAQLQAINADGSTRGDPIPVQFNPASLRLQITNQVEGGDTRGKQVRQYTGSSSTTLTVDLIFDTADEGETDAPVSVREKTMAVEQFLYPQVDGTQKQAPPRLRFEWGDLVLEGVVDSLNIDLDHFAHTGVPLRAKVGFSFKEQDRRYEQLAAGAGANDTGGAPSPGAATPGVVGSVGLGLEFSAQFGLAIGGESAAEFSARMGLDAEAWRGLSFGAGLGGSLSLEAGLEVGFSAGLSASAGVGVFVGASAGASVSVEAAFGLEASLGVTAVANVGADIQLQQSFSVTASGGVGAAIETVKIAKADAAAAQTKAAFGSNGSAGAGSLSATTNPATASVAATGGRAFAGSGSGSASPASAPAVTSGGTTTARPSLPDQPRTPLRLNTGVPPPAGPSTAESAPPPPAADPRSASYGFGVPLRSTVRPARGTGATSIQGTVSVVSRSGGTEVPTTFDPTVPPWEALPESTSGASASSAPKTSRTPPKCGCGGA